MRQRGRSDDKPLLFTMRMPIEYQAMLLSLAARADETQTQIVKDAISLLYAGRVERDKALHKAYLEAVEHLERRVGTPIERLLERAVNTGKARTAVCKPARRAQKRLIQKT